MIREDVSTGYEHMDAFTCCYVKYISSLSLEKLWLEASVRKCELAFSQSGYVKNRISLISKLVSSVLN